MRPLLDGKQAEERRKHTDSVNMEDEEIAESWEEAADSGVRHTLHGCVSSLLLKRQGSRVVGVSDMPKTRRQGLF